MASLIVVGVMAGLALGPLEPANIAVLFELKKPRARPPVIERLMKRFVHLSGGASCGPDPVADRPRPQVPTLISFPVACCENSTIEEPGPYAA